MQKDRIKSYGKRYGYVENKVKLSRKKIVLTIFSCLVIAEIILGVLWGLGY